MVASNKRKRKKFIIPVIINKFQYLEEEIINSPYNTIDYVPPIQNNEGRKRIKSDKPYITNDIAILNEDMFISDYEIIKKRSIIDDNHKPQYITKKTSLGTILQKHTSADYLEILRDVIRRTNIIVFHTYNFLKLYLIHQLDTRESLPIINQDFLSNIMKIVSFSGEARGRKPGAETLRQIAILKEFFDEHYKPLISENDIVSDDKLCFILQYECTDMMTNIENNIREHYIQHVKKFVDVSFETKKLFREIREDKSLTDAQKKTKKKKIYDTFNKVKNDILNPQAIGMYDFESDKKYHEFVMIHKPFITPMKQKYEKDSLAYDVKVHPMHYLECMFIINREINQINKEIIRKAKRNNTKPFLNKLFHPIPLRTSIIPKYITLDTATIVNIFPLRDKTYYFGKFDHLSDEIWSKVFTLNNKAFHWKKLRYFNGEPLCKEYTFNYLLRTDGVACSILFTKVDKYNRPIPEKKLTKAMKKELEKENAFPYIEDINMTNRKIKYFKNKVIVCIDPGHDDLIYCKGNKKTSEIANERAIEKGIEKSLEKELCKNDKINEIPIIEKYIREANMKENRFRYTRLQRNMESKNKYYMRAEDRLKKKSKVNGKTIKEIEDTLTINNARTTIMTEFKDYIRKKTKMNNNLRAHYEQHLYRRRKFNRYINSQRSESTMIKNFRKKYGSNEEVVIIFGDYDQKTQIIKKEPAITKRMKNLFRKNKYDLYMINEYNTSKICNKCSCETENFMETIDESGNKSKLWKLLRCKNTECLTIHNRDENATRNMHKIMVSLLKGNGRPGEYTVKENEEINLVGFAL